MKMCRVPAVIIAAVIGGAGLTACAASGSSPSAAASATALSSASGASPSSGSPGASPSTSSTHMQSAAAKPSVTTTASASARAKNSPHPTSSPRPTSSTASTGSGTHSFTVPAISGDNVVTAYGSYTKIGTARVKVTMCAKQTGSAYSVGALAIVYSASGASKNLGAVILPEGDKSTCVSMTFILYTAHLKVHAFIGGNGGTIVKTGPVRTIY
jgi:hypothetical protein